MKEIKILLLLTASCIFSTALFGQKVHFTEIEMQANGLYYRINTIPPFTGTAFDVYPPETPKQKEKAKNDYGAYLRSAKVREEVQFKEGIKDGKAVSFDQFGAKLWQCTFIKGKKEGLETQWYARGEKKLEINYTNNVPNGMYTEWWKNGKLKSDGKYELGREQGIHNWYFEDGQKDQVVPYKFGKAHGTVENWYPSGQKRLSSEFNEGKHHGTTTEWYENSKMKAKGDYQEGKENGEMKAWAKNGQLLDKKIYEKGILIESYDYRSAGIKTIGGFIQVFNGLNANYTVEITGNEVKDVNTYNIGYIVDKKILELHNTTFNFLKLNDPAEAIRKQKNEIIDAAKQDFKKEIEVTEKELTLTNGLNGTHIKFEVPAKKGRENEARRVLEEHFYVIAVKEEVLVISGAVTNNDREEVIVGMLTEVANSIKTFNEPIDLNQFRKK